MAVITYLDENDFNKKLRGLRRYFRKAYKYFIFKLQPTLIKDGKVEGKYEIELPTDELFKYTYGSIKVLFTVTNDVVVLEDLIPDGILMKCFERDLPIYKGVPYYREKDLKKIKISERLVWITKKDMEKN